MRNPGFLHSLLSCRFSVFLTALSRPKFETVEIGSNYGDNEDFLFLKTEACYVTRRRFLRECAEEFGEEACEELGLEIVLATAKYKPNLKCSERVVDLDDNDSQENFFVKKDKKPKGESRRVIDDDSSSEYYSCDENEAESYTLSEQHSELCRESSGLLKSSGWFSWVSISDRNVLKEASSQEKPPINMSSTLWSLIPTLRSTSKKATTPEKPLAKPVTSEKPPVQKSSIAWSLVPEQFQKSPKTWKKGQMPQVVQDFYNDFRIPKDAVILDPRKKKVYFFKAIPKSKPQNDIYEALKAVRRLDIPGLNI
ncbi:hypothetical protein L596_022713 [Steinernema carpocapsae]|uniref:Uncharacterized protein n=1 Tax=Steinernema carpocapsae TaxID=34508 RepID=A0A4U5MMI2_STECR|nr:hypothetical protein L596_022713 [Steinernema carpocapsae]